MPAVNRAERKRLCGGAAGVPVTVAQGEHVHRQRGGGHEGQPFRGSDTQWPVQATEVNKQTSDPSHPVSSVLLADREEYAGAGP